jgi:hypothetical protein
LARLPDKYRAAIVLCDLEGKARKDAAGQLRIPEGTLSSRLTTARAMLARRLARHGVLVSAGALAAVLSERASAGVPPPVVRSAVTVASSFAVGPAAPGAAPANVVALAREVLTAMLVTRLQRALAVLLVLGLSAFVGLGLARGRAPGDGQPPETPPAGGRAAPQLAGQEKAARQRAADPDQEDRIRPGDVLQIRVTTSVPGGGSPIDGIFRVEAAGTVPFGPPYGRVQVKGQTVVEAEATIRAYLATKLRDPEVLVTRGDPPPDERLRALERRVRQLEEEVRILRTTVDELQKPKQK